MGSAAVMGRVERRFFCCMRRWPWLVASDLARCFVIRDKVRPGQEVICPRWIARRKVDGFGLKHVACKYAARSYLVPEWRMAPLADWCW